MKRERHPEYIQSLRDREILARCEGAVEEWKGGRVVLEVPEYELSWTPESALDLVRELQELFAAYNRVLWERFPYCRACGGQCCVNEASHVGTLDGIALALLDLSLPDLPPDLPVTARDCIYLAGGACRLPAAWRTLKCWSFFCLGGLWDPALPGERYAELVAALQGVLHAGLPEALRRYETVRGERLAEHLHDPADFAAALDDALWEVLVGPLGARYPQLVAAEDGAGPADPDGADARAEALLAFIAEAMEQVLVDPPPPPEGLPLTTAQLLEDLETLEWIVVGRPTHGARLLGEMAARYGAVPGQGEGERGSVWGRMRACVAQALKR